MLISLASHVKKTWGKLQISNEKSGLKTPPGLAVVKGLDIKRKYFFGADQIKSVLGALDGFNS